VAGTYRIGPSDTFSGSDLKADADTLASQVASLDGFVEGNDTLSPAFVEQWVSFQGQWAAFYTEHFGGFFTNFFTALNDANRDQLISYENQFLALYSAAQSEGASLPNVVAPSTGSGDSLKNLFPTLPSAGGITGVLLAIAVVAIVIVVARAQ